MLPHNYRLLLGSLIILAIVPLSGAVCSRAIDIPIVVRATLPHQDSDGPFVLDIDQALQQAGIKAENNKIPQNAPSQITISHIDKFDLRSQKEIAEHGQRIHSIYINEVSISAENNTLSIPLPSIEISAAPIPLSDDPPPEDSYTVIASIVGLPINEVGILSPPIWTPKGLPTVRKLLTQFAIGLRIQTHIPLKPGQNWPKGSVEFQMLFEFVLVIKAI
jgi:hypothetical protein